MKIPAEYEWIKPGVTVKYAHNKELGMQICSLPFQQESGEWMAHYTNTTENGRVNCNFIKPYVSDAETLRKARAVLAEYGDEVAEARGLREKGVAAGLDSTSEALAALADALGGEV